MKNIKVYITLVLAVFVGLISCETTELDLTKNPNALEETQGDVNFLLNGIQEDFVRQIEGSADYDPNDNFQSGGATNGDGLSLFGMQLTRLMAMTSTQQYNNSFQGSDSDDEWVNAYAGILKDIRTMTPIAEEAGLTRHIGISQFIEAYIMTAMVDFYGDIPYTEAIQGAANLNPQVDPGASIYDAALVLLDNAIVNFGNTASAPVAIDVFYNKNYTKWVRAANTLKMRLYNQRRLVDANAIASINTILNSGNYITSSADDFQYNWPGTSNAQPDTRHPRFGLNYTATGATDYTSNWLMNLMVTTSDPRLRYYFYRQTDCTPGSSCLPEGDEQTLTCSLQDAPQHYIDGGFTFCYLEDGYWGRDHMDDDGTPPDGFLRTTFGVYPAGGNFDDDRFAGVGTAAPGQGKGITPILTAAWVDFMQAELAMVGGNTALAKTFMLEGMTKQISKVQSFISVDTAADTDFEPTPANVTAFLAAIGSSFDAASLTGKWDVLGEQLLVSSYGNGIESYNFYRRTGYPTTLQPSLEPNPGVFIRSMLYPSNEVNANVNITQKSGVGIPVFWDTNPTAPASN